jgi:hypothetical protein
MSRDAFVSYAARDRRIAHDVCSALTALGIRLWVDTEDLRRSRDTWRHSVQNGDAQSRALLVLVGEHWDKSPACHYELAIALERRVALVAMSLADRPGSISRPKLLPADAELIEGGTLTAKIALVGARFAPRRRSQNPLRSSPRALR